MNAPRQALEGLTVVELSSERCALAGKLLADMGARVILVEPPGGDPMRTHGPFLRDEPHPERCLAFWHYHTSKLGVVLDLEREREAFLALIDEADVLIEAEPPGRLASLRLDYPDLSARRPELVMISVTPFGRSGPRAHEQATDLTVLAGGGPAWSCGYDDHTLPPVRGGGNQGYHTGCHFGVMAGLVAILVRERTGRGQHVDVNMHAAANVTTEAASYDWLVARGTVQRQTGRHAAQQMTLPTQVECADGRHVNTGVPPRTPAEFGALLGWIRELGLEAGFPEAFLLELGQRRERIDLWQIAHDEELRAIFGAGREAFNFLAARLGAYEFFEGMQRRGLAVGIIYSPEEVFDDPHFRARGFPTPVAHPELGETFLYPGAPYRFLGTPWRIQRRAPLLGEHNRELLGKD
jgi:benzylsuccinate CoA-transferase BbsE subunit